MSSIRVKICGLSTPAALDAALLAGADLVGLVHFAKSPRHVDFETAGRLSEQAKGRAERVILLVDPDDALIDAALRAVDPDWIQLHGHETPERVAAIRAHSNRPVMKALGVSTRSDLDVLFAYEAADRILLDAKPPPDAALPGGNGIAFDWDILAGLDLPAGTMLSGGLAPGNVAEALRRTGLRAVDVSSGVETRPGEKSSERIGAFIAAVRTGE